MVHPRSEEDEARKTKSEAKEIPHCGQEVDPNVGWDKFAPSNVQTPDEAGYLLGNRVSTAAPMHHHAAFGRASSQPNVTLKMEVKPQKLKFVKSIILIYKC